MSTASKVTPSFGGRKENKVEPTKESVALADKILGSEEIVKPRRYNQGTIEVWDFILDQKLGFLEGNVIKYICRANLKKGIEDFKKARVYLDKLIAEEEKKQNG